jgi:hypothetical protein
MRPLEETKYPSSWQRCRMSLAGRCPTLTASFLILPIIDTPYFAELHANALPASFSGSDHLVCFNVDPEDS